MAKERLAGASVLRCDRPEDRSAPPRRGGDRETACAAAGAPAESVRCADIRRLERATRESRRGAPWRAIVNATGEAAAAKARGGGIEGIRDAWRPRGRIAAAEARKLRRPSPRRLQEDGEATAPAVSCLRTKACSDRAKRASPSLPVCRSAAASTVHACRDASALSWLSCGASAARGEACSPCAVSSLQPSPLWGPPSRPCAAVASKGARRGVSSLLRRSAPFPVFSPRSSAKHSPALLSRPACVWLLLMVCVVLALCSLAPPPLSPSASPPSASGAAAVVASLPPALLALADSEAGGGGFALPRLLLAAAEEFGSLDGEDSVEEDEEEADDEDLFAHSQREEEPASDEAESGDEGATDTEALLEESEERFLQHQGEKTEAAGADPQQVPSSPADPFAEAMLLMEAEGRSFHVYDLLANCSERDVRCQYELGVFYFLGVPPLPARNLTASLVLWHGAALGGSADAQYALALLHSNLRDLPPLPAFASSPGASAAAARRPAAPPPRVVVDDDLSVTLQDDGGAAAALDFSAIARYSEALMRRQEEIEAQQRNLWWLPLRVLERGWALVTAARDSLLGNAPRARTDAELRALFGAAEDAARSMPNFAANPGAAALAELYAAAASGHPGASMALAARTQLATADVSMRQGQACSAAVNFYLPYAKRVAVSYGGGIPQAPELLRFHSPAASVSGVPAAGGGLLRFAPASLSPGESAAAAPRGTGRRDEREGSAALHRLHPDSPDLDVLSELAHRGNADMQLALGKRYLFGVDGIQQNPQRARELLSGAADAGRTEARALLGYMDALGVGGEPDLFSATMHFLAAAARDDQPMALNGLGYLHFFGTEFIHKNELAAFHLFNISAAHAFPDAEANLAAMFVTGHGHAQSFVKAMHAYTKALRSGSTGAAYALGLMHLNGLGAVRDCAVASSLLKRVCEKGGYVTKNLQKAYMLYERGLFEEAAFHLLLLAEAGHEVSQTNLAFMFDSGLTDLFFDGTVERQRLHAQRFYQMAAANGSPLAELRLGDFAYYGYGVEKQIRARRPTEPLLDDDGNDMSDWISEAYEVYTPRRPSLRVAVGHYHRVADMTPDAKWLAGYVAKASFNLGFMRMQGLGLTQDFGLARQHFERCLYVDPAAPRAPVYLALGLLKFLKWRQEVDLRQILRELLEDPRIVLLLLMFVLMTALALLRVLTRRLQPPPHDVFFASHAHPVAPPSAPAPSAASSGSLGSSASPASSPASSGPASAASTSAAAAAPSAEPDSKSPTEARAPSLFESPVRRSSYPHFRGVCRGSSLPSSSLPTAGVSSGVSLEPEAPAPPAVGGPTEPAEDEGGLQANSGSSGAAHSDRMRRAQLFEAAAAKREKEAAALQLGESRENAFSSETDHEAQGGDSQGSEQVEGGQALPATSHANGLGAENAGGYAGFEHESDAVPHLQAEPSQSVDTAEGGMLQATGKDIWMRSEDGNRASVSMQSEMPGVSREQAENGNGESARSKDFDADVRTS